MPDNGIQEASMAQDDTIRLGQMIAERSIEEGGFREYVAEGDLAIENPLVQAQTALMLDNCKRWLGSMHESVRALTVGGFIDYIYPIIRASFPNNPLHEIVSVQPQTKRQGTIYWLNFVVGRTRGQFLRGQNLYDANSGWSQRTGYTDSNITDEDLGTTAAAAGVSVTLANAPLNSTTVEIAIAQGTGIVVRDNGNGGLVLVDDGGTGLTLSAGSVDYSSGAVSLTFSGALAGGDSITASYGQDVEFNENRAQIDFEVKTAGVTATDREVSMRYSLQALQDARAELNIDLDQSIVSACANALMTDTAGEVLRDLWDMAGVPIASFSIDHTAGGSAPGITRQDHFRDLLFPLNQASGQMYSDTQRGEATDIIVDTNALTVLRTIGAPMYEETNPNVNRTQGLVRCGRLNGQWNIWRYEPIKNFPGASATGNMLLVYKGVDYWDSGYVWAPYQSLYTGGPSQNGTLDRTQAWAMRYAKKRINAAMYKRVSLVP